MYRKKNMGSFVGKHHVIVLALMMKMMMLVAKGTREIGVGVILDMDSYVGKSINISILMALEDFYEQTNSSTVIIPHFRDSKYENVDAASAAIDLLKNNQVMAVLGPQHSSQAHFVLDIAQRSKVPMISPATNPDLSPLRNPYFIRISHASSTQAQPIAATIKSFGWKEVVFVYEDTDFGRGPISYFSDAMVDIGTQVKYRARLSPSSSDDWILQELYKLRAMKTRVFVVHMLPSLASRFFKKAKEAGMMAEGYAWIITDVLTDRLNQLNPKDIDSMQGVVGNTFYSFNNIPPSNKLTNFKRRWSRRFRTEYPEIDIVELDMFGIWAYDSVFGLAIALNRVETELSTTFNRPRKASTDLDAIGTSEMGSRFLPLIRDMMLKGMSGDFQVVNGQLQTLAYEIVNLNGKGEKQIGFWSSRNGISNPRSHNQSSDYTTNKDDLGAIIWPGDTPEVPRGSGGDIFLRIGVPANGGFVEFIEAGIDPKTKEVKANGFVIDVFKAVIHELPYTVNYNFTPYESPDGVRIGDYNDLIYQIVRGKFDMVVADVTILSNRTKYVDFTFAYSESGVSMLVPVKVDDGKNMWIFMKPLETELWITIGAFFIYTGVVVWIIEHRVNKEFRGPPHQQVGMIFWFSFSTIFFAQKEKMVHNLSRFVVIVWLFVVLVLTSSYTASFASMLTVQKLQPTITNIYELIARGEYVGYQDGSYIADMLKNMGFPSDKLKMYNSFQEYADALSNGSRNNGVSAIVDDVPYLKMLMAKNCKKYVMVGPAYKSAGFGFAFPKESPLVDDFSRAILKVIEERMTDISNKWFGDQSHCPDQTADVQPSDKLAVANFKGLFLISGLSSTYALLISMFKFLYENKEILVSQRSIYQKLTAMIQSFDEEKNKKTSETVHDSRVGAEENMEKDLVPSLAISADHQGEGVSSPKSQI